MTEPYLPLTPESSAAVRETIAENLKRLLELHGLTQKELAEQTGVTAASMTDYCKGRRIPGIDFFIQLKIHFSISIDEFLTKPISDSSSVPPGMGMDRGTLETYRKYCGNYYTCCFDTSKYKGRDVLSPEESLHYGVLTIFKTPTSLDISDYSCAAVLGLAAREEAAAVKEIFDGLKDRPSELLSLIEERYPDAAYYGSFELSQAHAFVSMKHRSTDRLLAIFHRVDNNKPYYTGGIGAINSISKGRERCPIVQFIGLTRFPLSISAEEIQHCLLLNYPTFKAEKETKEMTEDFRSLFTPGTKENTEFTDYQKSVLIRSSIERNIKKILERNMFRYGRITGRDDDDWYHVLKDHSLKDPGDARLR